MTRNAQCVIEEGNFEPDELRLIAKSANMPCVAAVLCLAVWQCSTQCSAVSKEPRLRVEISSSNCLAKLKLLPRYRSP